MTKLTHIRPAADALPYQREAAGNGPVHAVTFDCWGTLLYEEDKDALYAERVKSLLRIAKAQGLEVCEFTARQALDGAWIQHWELWHRGVANGPNEISRWALEELGIKESSATAQLASEFAELAIHSDISALESAGNTLESLARAGVRRALVCDTGFSPGHIVRRILKHAGLLELLEIQVFSDEIGVPKPDPRIFHSALEQLDVLPKRAVHVGDLLRTDIAGARRLGMGTIRITEHHDDPTDHPEADAVAESHPHLQEILGLKEGDEQ